MVEKLRESTVAAAAMDARLRATVQELKEAQDRKSPRTRTASEDKLSPTASTACPAETASHASSVSEVISERLKKYLDDRLARFSQDMQVQHNRRVDRRVEQRLDKALVDYSTIENIEQYVESEVGELIVDFVEFCRRTSDVGCHPASSGQGGRGHAD